MAEMWHNNFYFTNGQEQMSKEPSSGFVARVVAAIIQGVSVTSKHFREWYARSLQPHLRSFVFWGVLAIFILAVVILIILGLEDLSILPPISDAARSIFWIVVFVSGLFSTLLFDGLQANLWYWLRFVLGIKGDPPSPQPRRVWALFFTVLFIALGATVMANLAPKLPPAEPQNVAVATEHSPDNVDVTLTVLPPPATTPPPLTDTSTDTPSPTATKKPSGPVISPHNIHSLKDTDSSNMQGGDEGGANTIVRSIVWSPDNEPPMFAAVSETRVVVWEIEGTEIRAKWRWPGTGCMNPFGSKSSSVAWLHDGKHLVIGLQTTGIAILDTSKTEQDCTNSRLTLNDPTGLIAGSNVMSMVWIEMPQEPFVEALYVGLGREDGSENEDDSRNWVGEVAILNLRTDYSSPVSVHYPNKNHNSWVTGLAACIEKSGEIYVASVPIDQPHDIVKIWGDLDIRKNISPLSIAHSLAWHRTDQKCNALAIGMRNGGIAIYDKNGKPRESISPAKDAETCSSEPETGHCWPVSALTWSPNGNLLVSGSTEGKLLIWEWTPSEENGQISAKAIKMLSFGQTISAVAFSPDGKYIALGTADHQVYLLMIDE